MAHDGALVTVTWTRTSDALGERPRPQGLAGGAGVPGPSPCGGTCWGIARRVEGHVGDSGLNESCSSLERLVGLQGRTAHFSPLLRAFGTFQKLKMRKRKALPSAP